MKYLSSKEWWKKALVRAVKTMAQTLAGTLPMGFVVTPVMIQDANWTLVCIALAWLATGILGGIASLLTSLAGLPEVAE